MSAMMYNLAQRLAGLWYKIKRDSSAPVLSLSSDDIVVFVVGPTGSGKTWFVKEATKGEFVKSSRGYHPSTKNVLAVRCELTDEAKMDVREEGIKGIVFVDTPSVLTGCDDIDAQGEISSWTNRIVHKPRYLGVIYMHRIETDPAIEPIRDHLRELAAISRLSDDRRPLRVHIVASYDKTSGTLTGSKIMKHESSLRTQMSSLNESALRWKLSMHRGHFQGAPEEAWRAVEELLRTGRIEQDSL